MPAHLLNLPNLLTMLRVLLIPVLVLVYGFEGAWAGQLAAAIFVIAGITDWLDGFLARKLNLSSNFGAFLDPVADKLIVAAALIMLVHRHPSWVITLPTIIIISREIFISALREWLATLQQRNVVAVSWLGKVKTTMQMIAITLLLYQQSLGGLPIMQIGQICLAIAAILTIWSMALYIIAAWPILSAEPDPSGNEKEGS